MKGSKGNLQRKNVEKSEGNHNEVISSEGADQSTAIALVKV